MSRGKSVLFVNFPLPRGAAAHCSSRLAASQWSSNARKRQILNDSHMACILRARSELVNMAATAQATRAETATKQSVITSAQSLAVCRNLLKATVGQILYQRGLFDDSAFDSLKMANTTVKCLVCIWRVVEMQCFEKILPAEKANEY